MKIHLSERTRPQNGRSEKERDGQSVGMVRLVHGRDKHEVEGEGRDQKGVSREER